jgi:hypothetical protein
MVAEHRRTDERDVRQSGDRELRPLAYALLRVADADEGREAGAEQAQRQAGRVLVGVEPDHQHAEGTGHQGAGAHAGDEGQHIGAGVHCGREARDGGHQQHPLGTQVDDAGALVDEKGEARDGEHGTGVERGRQQQRHFIHAVALRPTRTL